MKIQMAFLALILFSLSSQALASGNDVQLSLSFLRYQTSTEGPQIGNSESTHSYFDFKLGWMLAKDLQVGVAYFGHNDNDESNIGTRRGLKALLIGYHPGSWFLDGSLILDGEMTVGVTSFKKAFGYGIDLGYQYNVGSTFFVGVQGSYKSYTFKEYAANESTISVDNKVKSEYYPMLILGLNF